MSETQTIGNLTGKPALPHVDSNAAAALCDEHLNEWRTRYATERDILAVYTAQRVLIEGASAHVELVATEVQRLHTAWGILQTERENRAGIRRLAAKGGAQ